MTTYMREINERYMSLSKGVGKFQPRFRIKVAYDNFENCCYCRRDCG